MVSISESFQVFLDISVEDDFFPKGPKVLKVGDCGKVNENKAGFNYLHSASWPPINQNRIQLPSDCN